MDSFVPLYHIPLFLFWPDGRRWAGEFEQLGGQRTQVAGRRRCLAGAGRRLCSSATPESRDSGHRRVLGLLSQSRSANLPDWPAANLVSVYIWSGENIWSEHKQQWLEKSFILWAEVAARPGGSANMLWCRTFSNIDGSSANRRNIQSIIRASSNRFYLWFSDCITEQRI